MNNEFQRMQKLAGLITESISEGDTDYDRAKDSKRLGKKGEENIYGAGVEKGEEIEKEKMSKSKLRKKIREMVLAEIDGAAVEADDYDPVAEAKKKTKKEDEEEDIDIDIDTPEEDVDVDFDEEQPSSDNDSEIENIQNLLDQLQDAAEKLGDEKLLKQIGNTITFFTRQHVAEKPELNNENY